jgi:hypothetical protein
MKEIFEVWKGARILTRARRRPRPRSAKRSLVVLGGKQVVQPSGSNSMAQTIRRTKAHDGRTLAALENEIKS